MKENKSKFPKSLSEIKLFPCPPAADDFCKQVSHKSDDVKLQVESYAVIVIILLLLISRLQISSAFIQAAQCQSEKQRGACVFSYIMLL